jgi:hypothetical protein
VWNAWNVRQTAIYQTTIVHILLRISLSSHMSATFENSSICGNIPVIWMNGLKINQILEQPLFGPRLNPEPPKYETAVAALSKATFVYLKASCIVRRQWRWVLSPVSSQPLTHSADGRISFSHICYNSKNINAWNKQNCNLSVAVNGCDPTLLLTKTKGVRELGAEEDIWACDEVKGGWEKTA